MSILISPSNVVRLDADVSNATTAFADVTGLSFPAAANADYLIEAFLVYTSTVITTGINFAINGPASPVGVVGAWTAYPTLTSSVPRQFRAYDSGTATAGVDTINVAQFSQFTAMLRTGAAGGATVVRFAAETANSVTVKAGSILRYQQLAPVSTVNTLERFITVSQLSDNLARMSRNMRQIVQQVKADKDAGRVVGPPPGHVMTFADAQASIRNTGQSFLDRLAMNAAVVTPHVTEVTDGAAALGIQFTDMTARYNLLLTWATTMNTAVITNQTELDNGVAAILAAISDTILAW
jgi:hypothetical protein